MRRSPDAKPLFDTAIFDLTRATALDRISVPLGICLALLAAWLHVTHPATVVLLAVLLLMLVLVGNARARLVFIVFGGLLIFQSSDDLTPEKMLYFLGAGAAATGAFLRASRLKNDPAFTDVAPLFRASIAFALLIAASLPVAIAHGTPETMWLRDAAPYMLFAAAPLFALDAATAFSARALRHLFVIAALAGSIAFATTWLSNRGFADLSSVIGLPTFMLGAALFAYSMAFVLEGTRRRLVWLVLASAIFAGFISTGTRSSAVLLAAPIAIVLGAGKGVAKRSVRLAILLPVVALLVALGVQGVVRTAGADRDVVAARLQTVTQTGGSQDQSYFDRQSQTNAAWSRFEESPLLGVGPGNPIEWRDSTGQTSATVTVDSPVGYLAKFGLFGLVPLIVLAWSLVSTLARVRQRTGERTIAQLGLIGFAGIFIAWSVLQVPFEDKGLATGFLFLVAIALCESTMNGRPRADIARPEVDPYSDRPA